MTPKPRRPLRHAADSAHAWARNITLGNPYAKAVLMALGNYVNDEGSCFVSIGSLALDTELSEQTVRKRLSWLQAIGAIVRSPRWRDEFGRVNADGRGKRTSDDIRLMIDVDPEEIEARAAGDVETDEMPVVESSGASPIPQIGQQNEFRGAPGVRQPYDSGEGITNEPEPENPPQTPPCEIVASQQAPDTQTIDAEKVQGSAKEEAAPAGAVPVAPSEPPLFASAFSQYPQHQLDNRARAATEFAKLPRFDQELVDRVAGLFARDIARAKRKPPAMWRWLRDRRFAEYGPGGSSAQRAFVAEGTEPWEAWTNVCRIAFGSAGVPQFWAATGPRGERGAMAPVMWPLGGEAWLVPLDRWVFVETGTPQWRRWSERIHEILKRSPMNRRADSRYHSRALFARDGAAWGDRTFEGLLVPSQWPPGKGARAGPESLMTAADHEELSRGI